MLMAKYTADWITAFNELKAVFQIGIQGVAYTIEHVGSTAVPHLDAKPIIDIDIIYAQQPDFEKIKSGLEKLGYYHNGNQGIQDREVFKRNHIHQHSILDRIDHHLYVCSVGSKALERHLLSRDYLRNHEWARLKYQQLKYELAEKANGDRKVYAALKELYVNAFIDSIVEEERRTRNERFCSNSGGV